MRSYGIHIRDYGSTSSDITISGGTLNAKGGSGALSKAPITIANVIARASRDRSGSAPETYDSTKNGEYKWFSAAPPPVAVAFTGLTANGSDTVSTTALTLTFDKDAAGLAANDITVTGATNGTLTKESGTGIYTLTISNITVADGGTVNVTVAKTGFTFTPTNKDVTVRKYTPPVVPTIAFTTQPAATTTVTAGSITGSLTAVATVSDGGIAALNWYVCSAGGTPSGNSLATGGTFPLLTDLMAGTYYYLCQATYTGATPVNSGVATVTVSATPVTPHSLTVVDGIGSGHYAEGALVPIYANAPQRGMRFAKWMIASGGGTLADPLNESTFYTMPGNDATVTATYEVAIQIITQPVDQYVAVGQQATFTIAATGDGLTYQWYINRGDGRGWQELSGKTGTSHTTMPVTLENDGYQYGCLIIDAHENMLRSGIATLHVSPVIIPPKTGDNSKPLLWLGMCLLGGLGIVLTTWKRRRA